MLNSIDEIIRIDKEAQQIVMDAQATAQAIIQDAYSKKVLNESETEKKASTRLEIVDRSYSDIANEDINRILQKRNEQIQKLDHTFLRYKDTWKQEVFNKIINPED
jgi:vacuolar-type H+-ATPase subunit H